VNWTLKRAPVFVLLFGLFCFSSLVRAESSLQFQDPYRPTVYVYADRGACVEGCIEAAVMLATRNGFKAVLVRAVDISGPTPRFLPKVGDLWIQPGGEALEAAAAIGPRGLERLRHWVSGGMNYLGFCAGVFLADTTVDEGQTIRGIGLIPFSTADYLAGQHDPMVLRVLWRGMPRWMYFQDGATFAGSLPPQVQVVATYNEGRPAVIQTQLGYGHVVLSGVHPEAPLSWFDDDGLVDPDGMDAPFADELLFRALDLRPVRRSVR
jgi:glutamine amidotransferase-like uncharacterized protein